ncbi:MAG: LacI family DNA-binding transcriptional regulator [Ilumatobacteraceae bacterium]
MSTLRDVAARAGVSVGTVSRVINREPNVAPALRERVEAAVLELDYQRNMLGRNLRTRRTGAIGVVVPDITAIFFAELVKEIEQVATKAGYSVLIGNSANSQQIEEFYLAKLVENGIDGMILSSSTDPGRLRIRPGAALVAVDRELPGFDLVASDHAAGARAVVQRLADVGHRRIACISGPQLMPVFEQRLAGYSDVAVPLLECEGIDPASYVRVEPLDQMRGIEPATELLTTEPRPTAIFAATDQQAIGVLRACADLGLRVPEDVSVAGFDDIALAQLVSPRLTTVRQPIAEIGRLAVEQLLARIESPDIPPQRRLLPVDLCERESTAPPAHTPT